MSTSLIRGSSGPAVRDLQTMLNAVGATPAVYPDGIFGPKTLQAVVDFQKQAGLVVDGIVGPQTKAALVQATTQPKSGKPEPDKSAMSRDTPRTRTEPAEGTAPPNVDSLVLLPTGRKIDEIIIHCTATPEGKNYTVNDIRAWHKARGFSDIGYHYVVYRDGRVMEGRPVGQVGAHVEGHNTGTIGISYVGGVTADGKKAKDTRTPQQRASLIWLVQQLVAKFPTIRKISGHNQYAAKACPSFNVQQDDLGKLV